MYNDPPVPVETFAIEQDKMIYTFVDESTTEEARHAPATAIPPQNFQELSQ